MTDQAAGDAAPLYLMAFARLRNIKEANAIYDLLDAPREKFSVAEAQKILALYQGQLNQIAIAARRDRCHWEMPFREQGFATLLPHLNAVRTATQLLALAARVEIAEGRFEAALHTLQSGFGMVAHQANDERCILVQGLVALGEARILLDRVQEFVQTPGAPNLYWALAELPHPMANMRVMASTEQALLEYELPELKGFGAHTITATHIQAVLDRVEKVLIGITSDAFGDRIKFVAGLMVADGPARTWLVQHGYDAKQVKDMPGNQAVGIYYVESYQLASDSMCKWAGFPWWQARAGYEKSVEELVRLKREQAGNPLLQIFPAMGHVHRSIASTDRRVEMLRIVEALRGYAAAHDGHLPPSLADLTDTPAPLDPMTGKAFDYEVSGNAALLRSLTSGLRGGGRDEIYHMTTSVRLGK
jgi:hypothetical protein